MKSQADTTPSQLLRFASRETPKPQCIVRARLELTPMKTPRHSTPARLLPAIGMILLCSACGDLTLSELRGETPDELPNDLGEAVIHEDVVILDSDPCITDLSADAAPNLVTIHFGCDPLNRGIEPGKIIVSTEGEGFLRRVESIEINDRTVRAWTTPASLAEAVERGELEVRLGEDTSRSVIDLSNTTLYEGTMHESDVLVRLNRGVFDIAPLIDIAGHWAEGEVQLFDLETDFDISADVELYLSSTAGIDLTRDHVFWEQTYPFDTHIGPLPVVGEAGVRAVLGFEARAPGEGRITTGFVADARWSNEHQFRSESGWDESPDDDISWEFREPDFEISRDASVRTFMRLEAFVRFYDETGPELEGDLFSEVVAQPECDGIEWEANAGLESRAKIRVNILDKFKPTVTFAEVTLTADLVDGTVPYPFGFPAPCGHESISCGETISDDTSDFEEQLDSYSCNIGNYSAPEAIYEWKAPYTGQAEWSLLNAQPTEVNHDVMVVDGAMSLVFGQCQAWGSNSVSFAVTQGQTYFLVVDGYHWDAGPFEARLSCF